jgi:hypothetical protein
MRQTTVLIQNKLPNGFKVDYQLGGSQLIVYTPNWKSVTIRLSSLEIRHAHRLIDSIVRRIESKFKYKHNIYLNVEPRYIETYKEENIEWI